MAIEELSHERRAVIRFAGEIFGAGGIIEEVASVLGDEPTIVRRRHAKWIPAVQTRQDVLL